MCDVTKAINLKLSFKNLLDQETKFQHSLMFCNYKIKVKEKFFNSDKTATSNGQSTQRKHHTTLTFVLNLLTKDKGILIRTITAKSTKNWPIWQIVKLTIFLDIAALN